MGFLYFIFSIWVLHFHTCDCRFRMENTSSSNEGSFTLDSVREALVRMEDTIVFNLIERAKFPHNSVIYDASSRSAMAFSGSMLEFLVKGTESVQAKIGRYESPEENPFFPNHLPSPLTRPHNYPQFLHPSAASVNINNAIWNMYVNELLPLFATEGDDGNYVPTAASDLECLQVLSRRIHYGKFVAEVKFRDAPEDYRPAIRDQDKDALMKLLTFESVEEMVKRRVEKKAMVYGQEVTLADEGHKGSYKLDPSVLSRLYGEWVMPLTKLVQVEYLLRRLD